MGAAHARADRVAKENDWAADEGNVWVRVEEGHLPPETSINKNA